LLATNLTLCADNKNTSGACGDQKNTHDVMMKHIQKLFRAIQNLAWFVVGTVLQLVSWGLFGLQMFGVFRFLMALKKA
jgi:hypothetical protein